MSRSIGRVPPHPMEATPVETRGVCVVRIDPEGPLAEVVFGALGNAILNDFAKFPESIREQWRKEAARQYGFDTYDDLRTEVLGLDDPPLASKEPHMTEPR